MDRIIEQMSNCTTQELRDIINIATKRIEKLNKEAEKTALLNFEKAFRKYVEINPCFTLSIHCEECGVICETDGEEALEQFFTDKKRFLL